MDKALTFNKRLKWGMAIAAIPVVALVLYLLFWAIVGLSIVAAAGGAALGGAILLALMPAISERLTQLKYGAFKAAVAAFPIESLDSEVVKGARYLKEAFTALEEKGSAVENFRMEVTKVEKEFPEDVEEARQQLADAEAQMAFYLADWLQHEQKHLAFVKEVARARRRWDLAQAGAKMRNSLKIKDEFMSDLRKNTAFEAVQKAHAESMGHIKLSRDVDYMRKRMLEAKEVPATLVFDTSGHVVLPQVKVIDYAEALERKAA